jgi:hypothetical protein
MVIHWPTRNLRAIQLLLGHAKLESIVRYLGIEVDDALEIAEQTECRLADGQRLPDSTVADRPLCAGRNYAQFAEVGSRQARRGAAFGGVGRR